MNTHDPAYTGPEIPPQMGEQLQDLLGLDGTPSNFGDYVDAMAQFIDREGITVDLETLCTTDQSPHQATFGDGTQHYHCTLDAIIVPFIADDINRVDVETVSPVSGQTITYTIEDSNIVADPPEATLSFGVAADFGSPPGNDSGPALAYRRICPYGKAFVSRQEFDQWARETDAYTISISMEDSLELARALGRVV